ncbi:hypothetical protein GGS21DRAFT_521795 [Xylaria nigripes]|nr:hypothetical protein GGS21DRAFT_521795 [Xylaria nigripes]
MWSFGTTMTLPKDRESAMNTPPQSHPAPMSQLPVASPSPSRQQTSPPPIISQRSLKQLGMFFAGAGFLSLAVLITRRSIVRRNKITIPKFFVPSNRPVDKLNSDGPLMALEALNLATVNVVGFGIMMTGGVSWAFDISSIDDLRRMARKHVGPSGGRTDEEAEREVEEWVAKILGRKEDRERKETAANSTTK